MVCPWVCPWVRLRGIAMGHVPGVCLWGMSRGVGSGVLWGFRELAREVTAVMASPEWCHHQHSIGLKWSSGFCDPSLKGTSVLLRTFFLPWLMDHARDWSGCRYHGEPPVHTLPSETQPCLPPRPLGPAFTGDLADSPTLHVQPCRGCLQ